jgi:hypothetical protein
MIDRYLSIWEIAHRWRDVNPDKSDPANLPLNIQDTIRYICKGVLNGELHLFDLCVEEIPASDNRLGVHSEVRQYRVSKPPSELSESLSRTYDKKSLDAYFIEADNLFDYCLNSQPTERGVVHLDFPSCWSHLLPGASDIEEAPDNFEPLKMQPLRPVQIDKLVCQAVAKTIWDIYPTMTITAMSEHTAILEHGGGKLYSGKNTLRDWVREVAPENVRNKPGRPEGKKSSNDAV